MQLGLFLVQSANRFQRELRRAAEEAARGAGVAIEVAFAEGDVRAQHEQLFEFIRRDPAPDGILIQPVAAAGARFVAREAHQRGVACAFINRHPAYLNELRSTGIAFSVTPDNTGIGKIQGEQFHVLLPRGGTVLYLTGPQDADPVTARCAGVELTKGSTVSIVQITGDWTEPGGEQAVADWLETTRGFVPFDVVGAQNDDMAVGARKALRRMALSLENPTLATTPITGVDGLAEFGQQLVADGTLAATVVMPPTSGKAVELLVAAIRRERVPEPQVLLPVESHPAVSALRPRS